jgi:hypothetical protein
MRPAQPGAQRKSPPRHAARRGSRPPLPLPRSQSVGGPARAMLAAVPCSVFGRVWLRRLSNDSAD